MKIANYLVVLFLIPVLSFGQGIVSQRVQKEMTKESVSAYSLVNTTDVTLKEAGVDEDFLQEGRIVSLDFQAIRNLQQEQPRVVKLSLPLLHDGMQTVTLIPNKVLDDGFVLRASSGRAVSYTPGLYYYGTLDGDPTALVAISVFDNEIHGLISTEYGNYVIGKVDGAENDLHVIYNDRYYLQPEDLGCATPDDGEGYKPSELEYDYSKAAGDCIKVYVEIDDDIVSNKGGVTGATNYITGAFNESITLYANDGLTMEISEMLAWDTPAPYSGSSSSAMLNSYQSNTGAFNGDLSHLVSYQASGGIAAGFAGVCNSNVDNSKCFSSIDASYSTVPTYSYTVMVITHEMGHLLGSRHTHACVWNGNNTAIDGCAGGTEGSCSVPGSPSSGGTIMSYCHITTGIDFTQGFGPQPRAVVLNTVDNASCTGPCGPAGPTCFDGIQNGNETGVDCGGPDCAACPEPCTGTDVTVTINLDNYPEETSWQITNAGGSVVASGGTYGSQPDGSTVVVVECLNDGCYDFTISDTYGDGICCSYGTGSYTVTSGGTTHASGGSFTSSETTNFCLGGGPAPTCSDGIQNGNETGVDCGGPDCAACPTCNDGIQNGNETDVDCGGPDCAACPTCSDGIQNGNETGVDCGGPDCAPCGGGGSQELLGSFFETGWDGWTDGGSDCFRYSGGRSWEGSYSIRIRDNSGTASAMTTAASYDVTGFSSIDIEFYFYPNSMETGEDFWVRYYDGSSWQTVASYASGTSFNNNTFYTATVTLNSASYNFPSNAQFRFQCDASANADRVYIDQVTITGNSGGFIEAGPAISTITELGRVPTTTPVDLVQQEVEMDDLYGNDVQVFPNPAQGVLNVRSAGTMKSIRIMSATGQELRQVRLDNEQHSLNIDDLNPGLYYLLIEVDGELRPMRFIKQ